LKKATLILNELQVADCFQKYLFLRKLKNRSIQNNGKNVFQKELKSCKESLKIKRQKIAGRILFIFIHALSLPLRLNRLFLLKKFLNTKIL